MSETAVKAEVQPMPTPPEGFTACRERFVAALRALIGGAR
jgi:hypothetical protein